MSQVQLNPKDLIAIMAAVIYAGYQAEADGPGCDSTTAVRIAMNICRAVKEVK
jgi:hypothetical protein